MNQIPPVDTVENPWPDGAGKLFQDAEYTGDGAFIYPTRSWNFYADGYQGAYERLFESWKTGMVKPDNLAYPLVFLCRHYVELRLKDIMETSQKLMSLPVAWTKTHKLETLWSTVRPLIEKVWPNEPRTTLNNVEALLLELDAVDPHGMAFTPQFHKVRAQKMN